MIIKLEHYLVPIGQAAVKILNGVLYFLIRFTKAFVTTIVRMAIGKDI
jgi:hypothetical protein